MLKFILLLALIVSGCATPRKDAVPVVRTVAGFENLAKSSAGPSIFYQGPFVVGEDPPKRQPAKVFLPIQYESKPSWPLVVLLHGFTGTADLEDFYLGLSARTSLRGFVLVAPNGTLTPKGVRGEDGKALDDLPFWNATDACCNFGQADVDDVVYLKRVVAEVKAKFRIDYSRVYIFGHSNGAFMANRMACEIGHELAGVASLAGGTFKDNAKCVNTAPVRYLQIHAVDDKTIAYEDAPKYAGARATVSHWLARNSCKSTFRKEKDVDNVLLIPSKDTAIQVWDQCASGKPVAFWTIKGHEHQHHNPHIPLFNLGFTDRVLDFLFTH